MIFFLQYFSCVSVKILKNSERKIMNGRNTKLALCLMILCYSLFWHRFYINF